MKKSLLFLGLISFAQLSNAAILHMEAGASNGVTDQIVTYNDTNVVLGTSTITQAGVNFVDSWALTSNPDGGIKSVAVENVNANVTLTSIKLFNSFDNSLVAETNADLPNGTWTLGSLLLASNTYTLKVFGSGAIGNGYLLNVSSVPVPAAIWLFGSALMGLAGFSRRKANSVQSVA